MVKYSRGERIFEILNNLFLVFVSSLFLVPVLSVLSMSFVGQEEWLRRGPLILVPETLDFESYKLLLNRGSIVINAYMITLFRVGVGTFLNLVFTTSMAYVLARYDLPGRVFLTLIVFVPMVFHGGLIPTFILVDNLGLLNKIWVMILPVLINPWYLLIMRNFFMALPRELEEAAIVDGASPVTILVKVVLPLSLPSIATIGLFYAVWHWNAWFDAAIYITDMRLQPVQVILRNILNQGMIQDAQTMLDVHMLPPDPALKSAMVIISTLPILCVYPFIQKYFVKGALVGSVKG